MHHMQSKSHCVNSVINNHTIQFLYLKNRSHKLYRVNEPWCKANKLTCHFKLYLQKPQTKEPGW